MSDNAIVGRVERPLFLYCVFLGCEEELVGITVVFKGVAVILVAPCFRSLPPYVCFGFDLRLLSVGLSWRPLLTMGSFAGAALYRRVLLFSVMMSHPHRW